MTKKILSNPFRPGAGHPPPYLAGRNKEMEIFKKLLQQEVITDNPVVSGLRGVGKTVLLEELKHLAIQDGWLWVGTDMSESASISEERLATRLIADLAVVCSDVEVQKVSLKTIGFMPTSKEVSIRLSFEVLMQLYKSTPGLTRDKLQTVIELAEQHLSKDKKGIVFAYDEAQNLADYASDKEFPLSLMIDLFQSIQKKGKRVLLTLTGLPTLLPKLVEARTSAERMFTQIFLDRLTDVDSRDAIVIPIERTKSQITLTKDMIDSIIKESGGYPYFIQFICREVYDVALQKHEKGEALIVSIKDVTRKLDADFFAGRWARATDRQRDLLRVIAELQDCEVEFTVQEIVLKSHELVKDKMISTEFSSSNVTQMLIKLSDSGFVYKNRHGKYAFAVPLLGQFIQRSYVKNVGSKKPGQAYLFDM